MRQAIRFKEGGQAPETPVPARLRLEALPGVAKAHINFVCCDEGKLIVYVGVAEMGAPTVEFRAAPTGTVELPNDVVQAGQDFEATFSKAVEAGDFAEDQDQGHALARFPPMRAVQMQFIQLAALHLSRLHDVLRNSRDAKQRALAAEVMGYAADKREVVDDLVYGMRDPDGDVRNNSARALWLIALLAQRSPQLGIHVPPDPFIELLNSIVWTDRNKASLALSEITDNRDPAILARLRESALPSLVEMARWKVMGHAQPALYLLGRIGGLSEKEIQDACDRNDREVVISAAMKAAAKQ